MPQHRQTDTDLDMLTEQQKRKRYVRFDPTINTGTLLQILVIVGMGIGIYTAVRTEQATQRQEIDFIKAQAIAESTRTKESLEDLKRSMREVQGSLVTVGQDLAVLKARGQK